MAADLNNVEFKKNRATSFPSVEIANLVDAVSIIITCKGSNAVGFKFITTGDIGQIVPGETKTIVVNGEPLTDDIQFTFNGAAEIEVSYATGVGIVPVGGGASAANQLTIISYLNGSTTSVFSGNFENPSFIKDAVAGNTDKAYSVTIIFQGIGGKLDGTTVPDRFVATYTASMRNEINPIAYVPPTTVGIDGVKQVLLSYIKL